MEEPHAVKQFGYRVPRFSFPLTLHVEILRAGTTDTIAVHGIDISANGIAIAVSEEIPMEEQLSWQFNPATPSLHASLGESSISPVSGTGWPSSFPRRNNTSKYKT